MYESHFGLARRPFASICQVEQYFAAASVETARASLARCLQRGEGVGMVVGPSGTGKTMLLRVLGEQFREQFAVALLHCGRLSSRRALFQSILHEMDERIRGLDEGELRLSLVDTLTIAPDRPRGLILLVDEAHSLPLSLLEEIRMLTNLANDGPPAVRVVLAGSCALEERFAHPKLDSFNQRIVARCYLEAMNRTETRDYVRAQIERVGGDGSHLFTDDACDAVYHATDGVARLVNQLCDHALLLAYANAAGQIDAAMIQEAWADLQQLPTPWNDDEPAAGGGVIEFGGLDDSPLEPETSDESVTVVQTNDAVETAAEEPSAEPESGLVETGQLKDDEDEATIRISPDTESDIFSQEDPTARVERIESLLADVDHEEEEKEEAASETPPRPVLELVYDDPEELLSEAFDDEEVISDRLTVVHGEPSPTIEFPGLPKDGEPAAAQPPASEYKIVDESWDEEELIVESAPAESELPAETKNESATEHEPSEQDTDQAAEAVREAAADADGQAPVEEAAADWSMSVGVVESVTVEPEQFPDGAAPAVEAAVATLAFETETAAAPIPEGSTAEESAGQPGSKPSARGPKRTSYNRLFAKLRYG